MDATIAGETASSKKKIIERVSQLMANKVDCPAKEIFESLFAREKLGTTALGKGIAIPHGRVKNCTSPTAVCLYLESPVDYDAPDKQPVDIIFAILVPEDANKEHLKYLADIATILSDQQTVAQIRHVHNSEALYQIVVSASKRLT